MGREERRSQESSKEEQGLRRKSHTGLRHKPFCRHY
jgi:hypothetical protein